jgi:O-antigen/teichoic acid export membrane protein
VSSTLTQKVAVLVAGRFFVRGAQLATFVILARELTVGEFGAYGVITSAVFLAGVIGNIGIRQAVARALGGDQISVTQAVSAILSIFLPLGGLSAALTFAMGGYGDTAFLSLSGASITVSIFSVILISLLQGVFLGRGQTGNFTFSESLPRILHTIMIFALWPLGLLTLKSALAVFAAGFAATLPLCIKKTTVSLQEVNIEIKPLPSLVKSGIGFSVSLFIVMLQGRVGMFFLNESVGLSAAGEFFAAQRAGEIILDVATAAGLVLFSETARSKKPADTFAAAGQTAVRLFFAFAIVGIAMAALSPLIVKILLGSAYTGTVQALAILSVGLGPFAATRIMNSVVTGAGYPWISAAISVSGLLVNIVLCYFLVPKVQVEGAAYSLVAAQALTAIGYAIFFRKICRVVEID